jgi:hypothetical protein
MCIEILALVCSAAGHKKFNELFFCHNVTHERRIAAQVINVVHSLANYLVYGIPVYSTVLQRYTVYCTYKLFALPINAYAMAILVSLPFHNNTVKKIFN